MIDEAVVIIADVRGSRKMAQDERYEGQLFLKSAIFLFFTGRLASVMKYLSYLPIASFPPYSFYYSIIIS